MTENGIDKSNLSHKQRRAITALLTTRTALEAAQMAKISPRTLARWLVLPIFREELKKSQINHSNDIVAATVGRLTEGQAAALDTLEDAMRGGNFSEGSRAAIAWFAIWHDMKEIADFDQRLTALEEAIK